MAYLEVIPAYGRDYKNKAEAQADWDAEKDFIISEAGTVPGARYGMAVNKPQVPGVNIIIRYGKHQKVMEAKNK